MLCIEKGVRGIPTGVTGATSNATPCNAAACNAAAEATQIVHRAYGSGDSRMMSGIFCLFGKQFTPTRKRTTSFGLHSGVSGSVTRFDLMQHVLIVMIMVMTPVMIGGSGSGGGIERRVVRSHVV